MMKWKIVRSPRSASADRSLECLRNDAKTKPDVQSDSNNNVGDDNNKQRDPPSLSRNTDCLHLRSFLGLSRQRSENDLRTEPPRRSRSEARGVSCDRLAHSPPGHTRSSSPPRWTSRRALNAKTIVTGSKQRGAGDKSRTVVDGAGILEEAVYSEIGKAPPRKLPRKKGLAPFRPPPSRQEVPSERKTEGGDDEAPMPPYHIDTPDYSTLDSVHGPDALLTLPDVDAPSGILRDESTRAPEVEGAKKTVRFEAPEEEGPSPDDEVATPPRIREGDANAVNVVVRSPAAETTTTPLIIKRSFVITVAKQEAGFRSLCATRRLEDRISVTLLGSVPRQELAPPPRGRSRERRPKEHSKKSHKHKKKESSPVVFVMPQAVIDELSQVLMEKRTSC